MTEPTFHFDLQCKHCGARWPEKAVMEAVALHFEVEHDTDKIDLNLVRVCRCGATMEFVGSRPTGGGSFDYFHCDACESGDRIKRTSEVTP